MTSVSLRLLEVDFKDDFLLSLLCKGACSESLVYASQDATIWSQLNIHTSLPTQSPSDVRLLCTIRCKDSISKPTLIRLVAIPQRITDKDQGSVAKEIENPLLIPHSTELSMFFRECLQNEGDIGPISMELFTAPSSSSCIIDAFKLPSINCLTLTPLCCINHDDSTLPSFPSSSLTSSTLLSQNYRQPQHCAVQKALLGQVLSFQMKHITSSKRKAFIPSTSIIRFPVSQTLTYFYSVSASIASSPRLSPDDTVNAPGKCDEGNSLAFSGKHHMKTLYFARMMRQSQVIILDPFGVGGVAAAYDWPLYAKLEYGKEMWLNYKHDKQRQGKEDGGGDEMGCTTKRQEEKEEEEDDDDDDEESVRKIVLRLHDETLCNMLRSIVLSALSPTTAPYNDDANITLSHTSHSKSRFIGIEASCGSGIDAILGSLLSECSGEMLCVSSGLLLAKGGHKAHQLLQKSLQASLLRQPCIIHFPDLHALTPMSSESSSLSNLDIEANRQLIETVVTFVRFVKNQPTIRILIVGEYPRNAHRGNNKERGKEHQGGGGGGGGGGGMAVPLHPTVAREFQETFVIPSCSPLQRRRIANVVLDVLKNKLHSDSKHQEYGSRALNGLLDLAEEDINAIADAQVGQSVASLSSHFSRLFTDNTTLLKYIQHPRSSLSSSPSSSSSSSSSSTTPFSSVYGHDDVKRALVETLVWPREFAQVFRSFSLTPWCGVLLYGPPGVGKTLFPRSIASELRCPLLSMRLSDVVSGSVGEGEKAVLEIFEEAKRVAPCIIFIDEVQAIFTARSGRSGVGAGDDDAGGDGVGSSLSSTLASCFDDISTWNASISVSPPSNGDRAKRADNSNNNRSSSHHSGASKGASEGGGEALISVIAATNEPWAIDVSFLRGGRLKALLVGPLPLQGRQQMIRNALHNSIGINNEEIDKTEGIIERVSVWVADQTDGYSGADIALLLKRTTKQVLFASMNLGDGLKNEGVWREAFESALTSTPASIPPSLLDKYKKWKTDVRL